MNNGIGKKWEIFYLSFKCCVLLFKIERVSVQQMSRGSDFHLIFLLPGRAESVLMNEITNYKMLFVKLTGTARQCKVCGKVVNNMKNHYLYHNPARYQCPICLSVLSRPDHLKQHIKWRHSHIPVMDVSNTVVYPYS